MATVLNPVMVIKSYLISEKISKIENLRKENFSSLIQTQLPNLHKDSVKAAISLTNLYALISKEEENNIFQFLLLI